MSETIADLVKQIDDLINEKDNELDGLRSANAVLRLSVNTLTAQLATARRSFGDAFVKGKHGPTGPGRPNRPKLSDREARDIRQAYAGGMKKSDLASNYGVHPTTIARIVERVYH